MIGSSRAFFARRSLLALALILSVPLIAGVAVGASRVGNWFDDAQPSGRGPGARTANPAGDLDQCANGPASTPKVCTGNQWVNGNLNANQAHYLEGDTVPYRLRMSNLATTGTHNVTIEWDTLQSGKHAIDYLTSFDITETNADPCSGVSGCSLATFDEEDIDPQPDVVAAGITQIPGKLTLFGGDITAVSAYTISPAGDRPARITISFTSDVSNPVLAWGGHIATRDDWGIGNSAVNIPGSPYHMRFIDLNGKGGNQDRSLNADAVIFPSSITITKNAEPDGPTDFVFTTTGAGLSGFSLDDDTDPALSNTQSFPNITDFKDKAVTEADPGPNFALSALVCSEDMTQNSTTNLGTRTASIKLEEGENVSCTFTNSNTIGTLRVIKNVINDADGTASASDFNLHVAQNGTDVGGSPAAGSATGTDYQLVAGAYTVSEDTPPSPYTQTGFSDDCDATGSVTVVANEIRTCTITNDDGNVAPTVSVDKSASPTSVDEPGGTVTFSVQITNTSSAQDTVTLTSLSDNVYGDLLAATNASVSNNTCVTLVGASIAPSQSISCSFDGAVSGNAGSSHQDTVTGTVTDEEGATAQDTGDATVTVADAQPAITVDKSAPASVNEPGGTVTFSVQITNNSNTQDPVTLTELSDDVYGDLFDATNPNVSNNTCLALEGDTITPGSSLNCSFDGAVSGNAGSQHTDTVTATATDDDATVTVADAQPAITVDKSAPASVNEPGGTVTFSVQITNNSGAQDPVTLTELGDDVYGDLLDANNPNVSNNTCAAQAGASIPPGQSISCSFDGEVSGNAGSSHTDTVTGTVTDDEDNEVSDTGDATVTVTDVAPVVAVEKSASPEEMSEPGGTVTFSLVLSNNSNAADPITVTALSDDVYGDLFDATNPNVSNNTCLALKGDTITPGSSLSCSFDALVGPDAGTYTDVVTFSGEDDEGNTATEDDDATVTITDALPAITLDKAADKTSMPAPGGTVTFTVTVTNGSVEPVTLGGLVDNVYGDLFDENNASVANNNCLPLEGSTIEVGQSAQCSFEAEVGPASGIYTDTVTATASDDEGNDTSATDSAVVTVLSKTSCPVSSVAPGGAIEYAIPYGAFGSDATDLTIVDTLPAEFRFASASPAPVEAPAVGSSGTVKWVFPSVPAGTTGSVTIKGSVHPDTLDGTTITNSVTLSAAGVDPATVTHAVLVSTQGSSSEARGLGYSIKPKIDLIPASPDTDDADPTNDLLSVPAAPVAQVDLVTVSESTSQTNTSTSSSATATTGSAKLLQQESGEWLVTAEAIKAVSSSDANTGTATSTRGGSLLSNVHVGDMDLGDVVKPTTVEITDPQLGTTTTVKLLEEIGRGAKAGVLQPNGGVFSSGLTVNAIHVTTKDVAGNVLVDVIVASASSDAAFVSGLGCDDGIPSVSGNGFALDARAFEIPAPTAAGLRKIANVVLPSTGGSDHAQLVDVGPAGPTNQVLVQADAVTVHTEGTVDQPADAASASTYAETSSLRLLDLDDGEGETYLISADLVRSDSVSSAAGETASSQGDVTLVNLKIAGVDVCATADLADLCTPDPNTPIELEGGVIAVLNEQIADPSGPGLTGLTVNAIHLWIVDADNPFELPVGAEVIVSSAHSDARSSQAAVAALQDATTTHRISIAGVDVPKVQAAAPPRRRTSPVADGRSSAPAPVSPGITVTPAAPAPPSVLRVDDPGLIGRM